MAQVKEKLITDLARKLYELLLNDKAAAVPHDNGIQNELWRNPYVQQKIIMPLRHHMSEEEIIGKFNEVYNQAAQDVCSTFGECQCDTREISDDMIYGNAGLTDGEYDEREQYIDDEWGERDDFNYGSSINDSTGELTKREMQYLTEMTRVFNDEEAAIKKTYSHFSRYGASPKLTKMYEGLMDWLSDESDYDGEENYTKEEHDMIRGFLADGLSEKAAIGKTHFRVKHPSPYLTMQFNKWSEEETAEDEECDWLDDEEEEYSDNGLYTSPPSYGF